MAGVSVATVSRYLNNSMLLAPATERKRLVGSLSFTDKVVIGRRDFFSVVRSERPDIIALGYDQDRSWLDKAIRASGLSIRIVRIPRHGSYSTSSLLKGIKGRAQ